MIKAVFFDIDGTLIDIASHRIPDSTIFALHRLREQGYRVGIASGRDMKNIALIPDLDCSLFDGFVASNGMAIFDQNQSVVYSHEFSQDSVETLLSYANEHRMTLVFETMNDIYCANELNEYVDIANDYYHEVTPPIKVWQKEPIIKISCFQKQQYDFSDLLKLVNISILPSPTTTYDFNLPQVSKLSGIHKLMKHWRLDPHAFMCFGDHDNDLEMIQGAKLGIAVKDPLGSLYLQQVADDVCLSAGEDGIYQCLKKYNMM